MASPSGVGVGLRAPHVAEILATHPAVPWLEAVTENYLACGPRALAALEGVRARYPLALHGVSLNLGSVDPLDAGYLDRLAGLVDRLQPDAVSDHVCWTGLDGVNTHDLLPLPYDERTLGHCARRIAQVQERLRRTLLVENVTAYLPAPGSEIPEWEFLSALAERTGCGLLLDVNNVYVSAMNLGFDPGAYLEGIPRARVAQIHLAGHERWGGLAVDTHGERVSDPVMALYERALRRFGRVPTLLEWDRNLPDLPALLRERARIESRMEAVADAIA